MSEPATNPTNLVRGSGLPVIDTSLRSVEDAALWLSPSPQRLHLMAPPGHPLLEAFGGEIEGFREGAHHLIGPISATNAVTLRKVLPNLRPRPLGLATSAGFGDRLGLATPGHVHALKRVFSELPGAEILPIFAQQSIREMTRTKRTPREVLDDATWGAFEAGWSGPVGADADHLKTTEDIDRCVAEGFSFYTLDPGDYVDDAAADASAGELDVKLETLPWDALQITRNDLLRRYVGRRMDAEGLELVFEREDLVRAATKYGAALAHAARMYRHLESHGVPFELEVSVDETETPTTLLEHAFLASELRRLGVRWISLAPRFVGRFEKGVDFRGDLEELTRTLDGHARIARALGPYKLSLHSGSDKFSVYGPIAEATRGMVHLKTAGTSYLEALRVAAVHDPVLFRDILELARERFAEDRVSYHLSASLDAVPASGEVSDGDLPGLLDDDDARQVLHVTFGSALDAYRPRLSALLQVREEAHAEGLARHFERHLRPFARRSGAPRGAR